MNDPLEMHVQLVPTPLRKKEAFRSNGLTGFEILAVIFLQYGRPKKKKKNSRLMRQASKHSTSKPHTGTAHKNMNESFIFLKCKIFQFILLNLVGRVETVSG